MEVFYPFVENPQIDGGRSPEPSRDMAAQGAFQRPHSPESLPDDGPVMPQVRPQTPRGAVSQQPELANPTYPARIAVYDDMSMPPRVVVIDPKEIREYLSEITSTVYELMSQQGGSFAFMMIRELVENYIHAAFVEPTISILDHGQTIVFSDQGPGIPNKQAAMKPSFTSATREMKRYIRGVGSGLPIVEEYLREKHGTLTIEDNLGHGTIVTVSLAHSHDESPLGDVGQTPMMGEPQTAAQWGAWGSPLPQGQAAGYQQAAQQPIPATHQPYPAYQAWPGQAPQYGTPTAYGQPSQYQAQAPGAGGQAFAQYGAMYQGGYQNPYYMAQPGQPQPAFGAAPQPNQAFAGPGASAMPVMPVMPGVYYQQVAGQAPQPMPAAATTGSVAGAGDAGQWAQGGPGGALDPKLVSVLRLFATTDRIGPSELVAQLDMSTATGSRSLQKLASMGYIVKSGQKYQLREAGRQLIEQLGTREDM